jgi:ADP-heptose:LPS heptosyltransferase
MYTADQCRVCYFYFHDKRFRAYIDARTQGHAHRNAHGGGLGDAVAKIALPIARGIDRLIGTNIQGCAGCSGRREKLNDWGSRLRAWVAGDRSGSPDPAGSGEPVPLILSLALSPGDVVVMTGVVAELHRQYPGRFVTDVRTPAGELWQHNPHITRLEDGVRVPVTYGCAPGIDSGCSEATGIHQSNQSGKHFMQAMADDLAASLELPGLAIEDPRGDIHLSDSERSEHPFEPPDPYWVVCAGGKSDYTTKVWPYYQDVISRRPKSPKTSEVLNFVQVGQVGKDSGLTHTNAPLAGVAVNLVGLTNDRDLVHLMSHASGVLCGVSYLMHLAAAFRKPAVILAGGREPPSWNTYRYPGFELLHTVGNPRPTPHAPRPTPPLDCCADGGCWKSRVVPLGDGDAKDRDLCLRPKDGYPACMRMISADCVIELIERIESDAMETGSAAARVA